MRYISMFSGIEAASVAWEPIGWEPICFCENDRFPSAVLSYRYPNVPNLGDITKVDWRRIVDELGRPDVVVGGSPCFVSGTLVLTDRGFKPIEDIRVGDMVVTHRKRLRRVSSVGHRESPVGVLDIRGVANITCTPGHPILASRRNKVWNSSSRRYEFSFEDESWVCAKDSVGMVACLPIGEFNITVPDIPTPYEMTKQDVMELIGWYIGDGVIVSKGKKNPTLRALQLSVNPQKLVEFDIAFGNRVRKRVCRVSDSQVTIFVYSTELCNFIEGNFGRGCDSKNMPAWVFALDSESKRRLVDGYRKTDGNDVGNGDFRIESASKPLMLAMQMLTGAGSVCKLGRRAEKSIKGHVFTPKQMYKFSYVTDKSDSNPSGYWHHNGYTKRLVRSFEELGMTETVYNLEVEDDNSYTADGIAVHNCQSFSIAGGRESLGGKSRLMYEYIRACDEIRSPWILWENVPGVLNTRDNAFAQLLREVQDIGYVDLAWRVLDAQFVRMAERDSDGRITGWVGPVAQRRRRVFLVGHLGTGGCAAAALFESESVCGNTEAGRRKRKELAAIAGGCPPEGGVEGGLNDAHMPVVIDRAAYNQGKNALYPPRIEESEVMSSLVARGPHAVGQWVEGNDDV